MKIAYVDMVGGAAGDMLLAAFLDAGVDRIAIEAALRSIVADGWTLTPERVSRRGIAATYANLFVPGEDGDAAHHHHHGDGDLRSLAEVIAIVERSGLTDRQKTRAATIYQRLADAEATVHGTTADAIHFHEVGQIDAILDVAATCVALDLLEIEELRCSPFPIGAGEIRMAHGRYPNPPPATAELLRGWPTRSVDVDGELVTTTAAAILTTLATPGPRPDFTAERIGYGAGTSDFPIPNVTRVFVGTAATAETQAERIVVIEANIDDMSPQHYELALERVFAAGALDVWLTPITMKKGRPAITLSAIAAPADEAAVAEAILTETTTIGVRIREERRRTLPRAEATIETPYGPVRAKRAGVNGHARVRPEYADLLRIARERRLPILDVAAAVEACIEREARS
ncbi:MAG TPA: nickel pincer cofactor biosynthesis protein LarC [Candidatus Elarobacter sp.]